MNRKLKFSELATALNVKQAAINVNVKRGKLIADENKLIDIKAPLNKVWIDGQVAKGKTFDLNRIFEPDKEEELEHRPVVEKKTAPTKINGKSEETVKAYTDLARLEIQQKKATLKKTQKAIELDELKIKKQMGQLIPFEEAKFLLIYIIEKIRSQTGQEVESMANIYKDRFEISQDEYIELKKDLTEATNNIIVESVNELKAGLEGIQEKYAELRGRGERM